MADNSSQPRSALRDGSFASGLAAHYEAYIQQTGNSGPVLVRITLANSASFLFEGMDIQHLENVPDCVMIQSESPASGEAVVVRENHILLAEIGVRPEKRPAFGFESNP